MGWIGPAIAAVGELASSAMASGSQAGANKTNVRLQRENQAWQQMMSNTAMQRRVEDLRKAGLNPVLAAGGPGASTPSTEPARVEATYKGGAGQAISSALLLKAQLDNTRANTAKAAAEARINNVEANIRERLAPQEQGTRLNRFVEQHDWDDLKTEILRSTAKGSAAEARRQTESVDALVQTVRNKAKEGALTVEQLENLIKASGVDGDHGRLMSIFTQLLFRYLEK